MTDWLLELAPGTLLFDKKEKSCHLVIYLEIQRLPISWTQLNFTTLSPNSLDKFSVEAGSFHDRWYKVRE